MKVYGWEPGIGDPTFVGWFTAITYFVAALLCWIAARPERRRDPRASRFWLVLTLFMVALGINKQLDLQTLFTAIAKEFAKSTGWYEDRRVFQAIFIGMIAFFGVTFALLAWVWTSRTLPQDRLGLVGGIFLICFIVIRASSFHHLDQILGMSIAFLRVNHVLELGGIACVGVAALRAHRRSLVGEALRKAPTPHNWKGSASGYSH